MSFKYIRSNVIEIIHLKTILKYIKSNVIEIYLLK